MSASIEGDAGSREDDHRKYKTLECTIPGLQKPTVANQPCHETSMQLLATIRLVVVSKILDERHKSILCSRPHPISRCIQGQARATSDAGAQMKTQGQRNMHCLVKLPRLSSILKIARKIARLRHLAVPLIIETEFLWAVCCGHD